MKITISKVASRDLSRMPANTARRIASKIRQYAESPASQENNVTKLQGRDGYRLRVGDWRVIFNVDEDGMTVLEIGPRGGIYG
ncbi:MAG: type II toxin-antitoxin system RelE/ParE family toxin [Rhodospirillales bacterium]|nr:type II toxin-antitoxin system RelE/ParE family toxin [Rhodospirillales bacterium]